MFTIVFLGLVLILLYWYGTRKFNYWEKKGIVCEKPLPFFGNSFKLLFMKVSLTQFFTDYYRKYPNERFIGVYAATDPALIVTRPEDVQRVMVSDFNNFYIRGIKPDKHNENPFENHLFLADGDLWKLLRQRMTPAFTSGKLKAMFPLIVERAEKLQELATERAQNGEEVNLKELIARYTTDFIGACGFGINMDSLSDEQSIFRKLGVRIFTLKYSDMIKNMVRVFFPFLSQYILNVPPEVPKTTTALVNKIMQDRNNKPSTRNDFIDLLLEVKQKGNMVGESIEKRNPDGSSVIVERALDDGLIASQAFVFFAAGFETSSSTSSHTLHLLAFHQDKQKKCHEEIDRVLEKYDNKLCYDAINEMKYLKMCFNESMRILPTLGVLNRKSTTPYTFPDSNLTIDKDIAIVICTQGMQMDEKYFDEPTKFIPERFDTNNGKKVPNHVFLPFGEGPRACIGERLGLMQALAGLAAILSKFTVVPSKNSQRHPPIEPRIPFVQSVKGGIPAILIPRKKNN